MSQSCKYRGVLTKVPRESDDGRRMGEVPSESERDWCGAVTTTIIDEDELAAIGLFVENRLAPPEDLSERIFVAV